MSFHHVRLVHGSAQNVSSLPRTLLLYEYGAADAWPLMGVADLAEFDGRLVIGEPTIEPRMVPAPVRLPLPPARDQGSIYENQSETATSLLPGHRRAGLHFPDLIPAEASMDARDLLLDEHGRMHAASVTGDKGTLAERTFGGLSDDQMRVRPREDLNSLAWLMWHIARAEDIFSNIILSGRDQVVDDGWLARLKISRRDFGIGMTKPEVAELTAHVDVAALRDYRDAVGRRTQEVIRGFVGSLRRPSVNIGRPDTGAITTATTATIKATGELPSASMAASTTVTAIPAPASTVARGTAATSVTTRLTPT